MTNQEQVIADIAREVVARLRIQLQQGPPASAPASVAAAPNYSAAHDGVFVTVDEAARAANIAQKRVQEMSLEDRGRMISIVRRICIDRSEELGRMELEESRVGQGVEIADERGVAGGFQEFGGGEEAELLNGGGDFEQVAALRDGELVVEDIAARDAAHHFHGAGGAVEAV